ncbi:MULTISPECIES: hypothetical protein [Myxococcus]|uniref:hypothetical protein n=1 Tax=Myxococcus TaxID=32 RepID=UPI0011281176|nr:MULTISPECIES: hypothetical protein [Myxococcus]QDE90129.1 hypothetical protein BHS06_14825 [Myxococcus xanthus]QDF05005.1 hypothetical protein BHS04_17605 [Myxococcus xanthus]WAM28508.1 hypothetical protein OZ403_10505 [Myxococcus sp. NMCA1]
MVKLTGQSPDEVRRWAASDVVHLLAHNALEVEDIERSARGQTPRTGPSAARGQSEVKSLTYRVRPRAKE